MQRVVLSGGLAVLAACGGAGPDARAASNGGITEPARWSRHPADGGGLLTPGPATDAEHAGTLRLGAAGGSLAHPDSVLASPRFVCGVSPPPGSSCRLRFTLATELHDGERLGVTLRSVVGPHDARTTRVVQGWVDTLDGTRTYALSIAPCSAEVWASFAWDVGRDEGSVASGAWLGEVSVECRPEGGTNFGAGITGTLHDEFGDELEREPRAQVLR